MNDNNIPLVSVCMITYNQEKYIAEAIEGVLMQQTNFPVELVIGEDCSTDNTRNICLEYKRKNPDRITLLLPEKNLGMIRNLKNVLLSCCGKYFAFCEGDDYWIDPYKLQKQVDFLEANEDFSICFHAVKIKNEKENIFVDDYITQKVSDVTDIYRLAQGNYIHTPSVMYRKNEEAIHLFFSLGDLAVADYILHMLYARYGKIKKLPDMMAIYRAGVGIWSTKDYYYHYTQFFKLLEKLMEIFIEDEIIKDILNKQYGFNAYRLYSILKKEKDTNQAKAYFLKTCHYDPDLVYEEFEKNTKKLDLVRNSIIYRLGKIFLKPFLKKKI